MHFYCIMKEISYYCINTVKKSNRDFSLPPLSAYAKMISSSTISNAHALMLFKGCTHFKAFSSFSCRYALFLFHALYEPVGAFLRLSVDVGKVGVKPAACEKIGVCNFAVLLQIVQMPLPPKFLSPVLLRRVILNLV